MDRFFKKIEKRWQQLFLFVVFLAIGILVTTPNISNHVNMAYASYGIYPLFYVTIIIMAFAILMLSKAIDNPFTSEYGKFTLPIYAFHLLIMGVVTILMTKMGIGIEIAIVKGVIVSIITLTGTVVCIKPIKRFAPNLVGIFK